MKRMERGLAIALRGWYFRVEFCQNTEVERMKRRKVLLVDTSRDFCDEVSRLLAAEFEVWTCRDGCEALTMLENRSPDVLVTELALPGVDGLSLLKTAAARTKRPAMLVITCYRTPFIQEVIGQIGVDYMMLKPCNLNALVERVRDLSECDVEAEALPIKQNALNSLLLALGVPAGRRGYTYLEVLIELYRRDPGRSLTKDLYPTAGRGYQANGAAVERSVRGAIETAWMKRDETVWRQYFPASRFGVVAKPTNRAFIATVAAALDIQEQRRA